MVTVAARVSFLTQLVPDKVKPLAQLSVMVVLVLANGLMLRKLLN